MYAERCPSLHKQFLLLNKPENNDKNWQVCYMHETLRKVFNKASSLQKFLNIFFRHLTHRAERDRTDKTYLCKKCIRKSYSKSCCLKLPCIYLSRLFKLSYKGHLLILRYVLSFFKVWPWCLKFSFEGIRLQNFCFQVDTLLKFMLMKTCEDQLIRILLFHFTLVPVLLSFINSTYL